MTEILHVVSELAVGGSGRAILASAKYSARSGLFHHRIAALETPAREAISLARSYGIQVIGGAESGVLRDALCEADIVQVSCWNNPGLYEFLRSDLPSMRLCLWFHIAGDRPPQILTDELVNLADVAIACSPYTFEHACFQKISQGERARRSAMVYGATDFERLGDVRPRSHSGFNIGYIGTLNTQKIHPRYSEMSASIEIPSARFIVCGEGGRELKIELERLGALERFDFRGFVEDIAPVLRELDVFGYPLCEDTYAASELVLQEAMYAGVPPVVFPHGGIRDLVSHESTGLVVTSDREYKEAIEYLFHEPAARTRLGQSAREYAQAVFGAENAARELNAVYRRMLERPKRRRCSGLRWNESLLDEPLSYAALTEWARERTGADALIASLGKHAESFRASIAAADSEIAPPADQEIAGASELLWLGEGGVRAYQRAYPKDPYLRFWSGLILERRGQPVLATREYSAAQTLGFEPQRLLVRLLEASAASGSIRQAERTMRRLSERAAGAMKASRSLQQAGERTREARAWLDRAREHLDRGDDAGAEPWIRRILSRHPDSPEAHNALAECELARGETESAIRQLGAVSNVWPDHPGILNNLAVLTWQSGDWGAARTLLERAMRVDPEDRGILANLSALSAIESGARSSAAESLPGILSRQPDPDSRGQERTPLT